MGLPSLNRHTKKPWVGGVMDNLIATSIGITTGICIYLAISGESVAIPGVITGVVASVLNVFRVFLDEKEQRDGE